MIKLWVANIKGEWITLKQQLFLAEERKQALKGKHAKPSGWFYPCTLE